jgi:hypothetical protein
MQLRAGIAQPAMYWVALCSNNASRLAEMDSSCDLFSDEPQSVYEHYNDQVRKNIQAGQDLQARDSRIVELEQRLQTLQQASAAQDQSADQSTGRWRRRLASLLRRK